MIIDFIKLKQRFDKYAFGHLKSVHVRDGGFLNLMKRHTLHEGHKWSYQTVDNERVDSNLEKIESVITVANSDLPKLRFHEVLELYAKMASDFLQKQHKQAIERITDSVEAVGNSIDARGRPFSESTLEMLEKLHIDFDEHRNRPNLPTLVVHPDTFKKMQTEQAAMSAEQKAEHERKQSEILDRKYQEYVLLESNRKLVD